MEQLLQIYIKFLMVTFAFVCSSVYTSLYRLESNISLMGRPTTRLTCLKITYNPLNKFEGPMDKI